VGKPGWDEYFIGMLDAVAARASCDRGRSSAILVKNNRIISTGYVGAPKGLPTCDEVGHDFEERIHDGHSTHCVRTFHAEMNAILGCAKEGVSTVGATMYCSMVPCRNCGMAVVQAGIVRVVARMEYQRGELTKRMFETTGIELMILSKNAPHY